MTVHMVVTDEGLYVGTGLVHRWLLGVGNRMYQNIVHAAPERTGELKMGIELDFEQGPSLRILSSIVSSTSPHTGYVIHGTALNGTGYIYTTKGWENPGLLQRMTAGVRVSEAESKGMWMVIRDGGPRFHLRVHGQRANNFLAEGYNATARTHRALHPIFPGVVT